jgi:TRAP transporter TAXI family solute receptor
VTATAPETRAVSAAARARVLALLLCLAAPSATAQTLSILTTPPGSYTNSVGAAVAKVILDKTGLRAVVQPQASIAFDDVESGASEFTVSNAFDVAFFASGTGEYEGRGVKKNIRLVGALLPFRVGLHVRAGSSIQTLADLKGKRVSSGFNAQKTVGRIVEAHLANAGLSYDDVIKVPTPNVAGAAADFISGKVDVLYFAMGSGSGKQASASVGGLRVLELDAAPAAVKRLQAILPGAYVMQVEPEPGLDGVTRPTNVLTIPLVLDTSAMVTDDIILKVTKAIHDNPKELTATFAPFKLFDPRHMARPVEGVPFHPGAIQFYQDAGLWQPRF